MTSIATARVVRSAFFPSLRDPLTEILLKTPLGVFMGTPVVEVVEVVEVWTDETWEAHCAAYTLYASTH